MKWGMVIDLKRCIGCYACQLSCKAEHGTPPGVFFARVLKVEEGQYPSARNLFLPVLCNHCENAPCVDACPTGASFKWEDGTVDIDHDKCVGCKTCMMACPYDNRYYHGESQGYYPGQGLTAYEKARVSRHQEDVVMKCDFCRERRLAGKLPACVTNCPTVARIFGDLDDATSEVSRLIKERGGFPLHPELGTKPSVYYLPP